MSKKMEKMFIIVDGSNVAFFKKNKKKEAKLKNLEILISFLDNLSNIYPITYEILTDASLKYRIDKKSELEILYNTGKIVQCPSKRQADDFLLEFFKIHPTNTLIISNDNFSEYDDINPVLCKFMIIFNDIITIPCIPTYFTELDKQILEEKVLA